MRKNLISLLLAGLTSCATQGPTTKNIFMSNEQNNLKCLTEELAKDRDFSEIFWNDALFVYDYARRYGIPQEGEKYTEDKLLEVSNNDKIYSINARIKKNGAKFLEITERLEHIGEPIQTFFDGEKGKLDGNLDVFAQWFETYALLDGRGGSKNEFIMSPCHELLDVHKDFYTNALESIRKLIERRIEKQF